MRKLGVILVICISYILVLGCGQEQQQTKDTVMQEMQQLIEDNNYESARIAAIQMLDPDIRELYHKADDNLGHASHLDVRCNERIEEILAALVKKVPAKNIRLNRDIYFELVTLYPQNNLYKKKFIFYDRKVRRLKAN
jgi:hypothetical protein